MLELIYTVAAQINNLSPIRLSEHAIAITDLKVDRG